MKTIYFLKAPKHIFQLEKLERPCSFISLANCLQEKLGTDDQRAYGIVQSADSLLNKNPQTCEILFLEI